MANPLAVKIESFLSPLLGEMMAHSTVMIQCKKIGTIADELKPEDLPKLAERIEKALIIFVGSEKARKTAEAIKSLR